jgi:hypothetical protein
MEDLTQFSDGLGFEVLASSLRADLTDTHSFLNALAEKLGGALPQQSVIERKGGLFAKEKPVHKISIELGEHRYFIEKAGNGGLRAGRIKIVRGIALKTEELPIDRWIDDLSRDLAAFAARSSQARAALDRLLT